MISSESYIDGVKVQKGATIPVRTNLDNGPRFRFEVECQNDEGTQWRATVKVGGTPIIRTDSFSDHVQASRAAEDMLVAQFVAAFGKTGPLV